MDDDKLVRTAHTHTPPKYNVKLTQTAGHVCSIEIGGVMRNIPMLSDPLTHSGRRPSPFPRRRAKKQLTNDSNSVLARTHLNTIPFTIAHIWAHEGTGGFYRGLATNIVRVLPGTCVTFVVYENLAWLLKLLKRAASRRSAAAKADAELGAAHSVK